MYGIKSLYDNKLEIMAFGDTVKINQIGTIDVSTYTPDSTTITTQTLSDGQKELKINQYKYFSFKVKSAQLNSNIRPESSQTQGNLSAAA